MKNLLRKIGLPIAVLLAGLLALQASDLFEKPKLDERQFDQVVNLALRQAAAAKSFSTSLTRNSA